MHRTLLNSCLRLLGVALLVTPAVSSAQQHAHAGGDRAHRHEAGMDAVADPLGASRNAGWFAAPLHVHVFLLGFEFTLPGGTDSPESPASTADNFVPLHLAGDHSSDAVSDAPVPTTQDTATAASLTAADLAAGSVVVVPIAQARSATLCDAARHERSGVLRS